MNIQTVQLVSLTTGLLAYSCLFLFSVVMNRRGVTGWALLVASGATSLFILSLALTGESLITQFFENLTLVAWTFLVLRAIGLNRANVQQIEMRAVYLFGLVGLFTGAVSMTLPLVLIFLPDILGSSPVRYLQITEALVCVVGLVSIEQLVRNTRQDLRWRIRFLNIGVGVIFTFGLLHSALSLMVGSSLPQLTILQPAVLSLSVPLLILASLRNRDNQLRMNLSRQFVFRSGVLMSAGFVLLIMGLAGYYLQITGGQVGMAVIIMTATLTVVGFLIASGSERVQSLGREVMHRYLYDEKHDYREQWAQVTKQLTEPDADFSLEQQAIRSLAGVLESSGGALWRYADGRCHLDAQFHVVWPTPIDNETTGALEHWFDNSEELLDCEQLPLEMIEQPSHLTETYPNLRYLVPLKTQQNLIGIVGIRQPRIPVSLTSEDEYLVRLVAREAAGFIALKDAQVRISESKQFDAMNKLASFFLHDIKTINAQLSLLVQNGEQHKCNPRFVDDMLATISNAVAKTDKLILQIASGPRIADHESLRVEVSELVRSVCDRFSRAQPSPVFDSHRENVFVSADSTRFADALGHLVQNAIEATDESGEVVLTLDSTSKWVQIRIKDTGCGMDEYFIANRLFAPFSSTKGVTGMGIGAYQVRDYVRSLGGDIEVNSELGKGSEFVVRIPAAEQ